MYRMHIFCVCERALTADSVAACSYFFSQSSRSVCSLHVLYIYMYGLCLWCRSFPFSTSLFFSFYFSGISDVIWHIRRGFSWCHFDDGLRTIGINMFFVTQFPLILIIRVCKTSTVRASASDNFCDQFVVTDAHASLSLQVEANFDSGSILTWTNSIDICMSILLFSIRIVVTDCVVDCVSK